MSRKRLDPIPPGEILREEFMRPLGITARRQREREQAPRAPLGLPPLDEHGGPRRI